MAVLQTHWYDKAVEALKLNGKSERTQEAYARHVRKLIEFQHKDPDRITEEELRKVDADVLNEQIRGNSPRYWEDVKVGDELHPVVKGVFGLMDMIGLNTCWQVTNHLAKEYPDDPQVRKNAEFLTGYVDKGWLGVKSGQGFYTYPDPAFSQSGFLSGE